MLASRQHEGSGGEIVESHWVEVAGGQLHARAAGNGPLVIFLHGWTLDWRIWSPQMDLKGFRLAMPDRRGFGRSSAPPNLALEYEDVLATAEHFGAHDFAIVGLSQGAAVALDCARRFPERLRAITVIGAPLHLLVPEPGGVPEIGREAMARLVRNGRLDEMMAQWQQHPLTKVAPHAEDLLAMILVDYDGRDQVTEQKPLEFSEQDIVTLEMPVLAIAGAQDSYWRRQVADYIGKHAPYGHCNIIPHAGHIANVDAADGVNHVLKTFLNTHHIKGT